MSLHKTQDIFAALTFNIYESNLLISFKITYNK